MILSFFIRGKMERPYRQGLGEGGSQKVYRPASGQSVAQRLPNSSGHLQRAGYRSRKRACSLCPLREKHSLIPNNLGVKEHCMMPVYNNQINFKYMLKTGKESLSSDLLFICLFISSLLCIFQKLVVTAEGPVSWVTVKVAGRRPSIVGREASAALL